MPDIDLFLVYTVLLAAAAIVYAYVKGKIDLSAVAASGIIGAVALLTVGGLWLYLILAFFVAGNLVTRYRYDVKEHEGVAEKTRSFQNVFGNGGAAIVYALLYQLTGGNNLFILGFAGAMATATADTFATEIGEVHALEPRMITTFRKVRVGTSGAVSLPGSVAALAGAAIIAWIPLFFQPAFDMYRFFAAVTVSGFLGCLVDSIIGATMERKVRIIDNHMTNFIGTLFGGAFALAIYSLLV